MPGKHLKQVRFANDAFPDTPSPTFSSMSLSSSGGPRTPVSAAESNVAGSVHARIHPLLDVNKPPMLNYNVSQPPMPNYNVLQPPSTIKPNVTLPPHVLNELATNPPMPSMVIRCSHLPWTITILPTNTKYVTVRDVLDGIYRSLRHAVHEAEYHCLPSAEARYSVNNAYIRRCKRLDDPQAREFEKGKGVKRVDFLGERTLFTGLTSTTEGPHFWFLSVSWRHITFPFTLHTQLPFIPTSDATCSGLAPTLLFFLIIWTL